MNTDKNSEIRVKNIADFLDKIQKDNKSSAKYLYRGLSNSRWKVKSTAGLLLSKRELESEEIIRDASEFRYNQMLVELYGQRQFSREQNQALSSDLEILAHLRHHKNANSLIDFTGDPLIAAWFACQVNREGNNNGGAIHVLDVSDEKKFIEIQTEKQLREYTIERILKKDGDLANQIVYWQPPDLNKRIPAQNSYLVIGRDAEDYINTNTTIYIISETNKKDILENLSRNHNVDGNRLFPDMIGFAELYSLDSPYGDVDTRKMEIDYLTSKIVASKSNEEKKRNYFNRANTKLHKKDYDEAIEDYSRAIRLDDEYIKAYYNRAVAKHRKANNNKAIKNYDAAIRDYDKVIELKPEDYKAYNYRGLAKKNMAYNNQAINQAIKDFDRAIELNPQYPGAHNNRGLAKKNKRDTNGAIRDFNKAIKINPQYAAAYNNRGLAKKEKKDDRAAIKDFNKAIKINPQYAAAYYNRGLTKKKVNDNVGATMDFNMAIKLDPKYHQYYKRRLPKKKTDNGRGDTVNLKKIKP